MKYPWVTICILAIWAGTAAIVILRGDSRPEIIVGIALIATTVVAFVGFKPPK